ncbi:hypothetical protein [Nannocystis sp. SCPEA4]|uniref:hypothetical protein n=1 Tax=Nannocystis sp. SCPEA4 TaxID=2996787 RepID=UPI00226E3596|nr:hypothetical protein [Nannocystis sp. SCPEA4]MCY1059216.1 hypothetical protein [Nannocystis sp. SCPEA4]
MISWSGLGLLACGDDGNASTTDATTDATTDGPTTGGPTTDTPPTTTTPTTTAPTTGDSEGDSSTTTGDTSTTGDSTSTGDEPGLACHSLELPAALVDDGSWDEGLTISGFAGYDGLTPSVHDFARDAGGDLLAVGYFHYIGTDAVHPFARREGGAWIEDPSLGVALERPTISAVAADDGGRVALATYSALPADLMQRKGEILLADGGEFEVVATFHGAVRSMAWYGGELWVAGVFALDDEPAMPHLAVYGDMGWHEPPGGALAGNGAYELTVDDDTLLVGGNFTDVGGVAAQSVAAWDGADWTAFDLPNSTVYALARDGQGDLYAGGLFSVENSVETGGIARWSGQSWQSVAGGLANPSFRGVVSDLAVRSGDLYVAGCFTSAGGVPSDPAAIPTGGVARWAGGAWEALTDPAAGVGSAWFSPLKCGDEGPAAIWEAQYQRMIVDGEQIVLGGAFSGVDAVASQSVIVLDADDQWVAEGEPGRGFSGATRSLAVGGPECAVHVMGGVTHAGALKTDDRVLRDDGDAWTPVGPSIPAGAYCWQLAVDSAGTPVLGCDLPPEDDEPPAGGVLRLENDSWQVVGEPFVQGGVAAVGFDPNGALWAAGGGSEGFVAREDAGLTIVGESNGRVSALAFRPTAPGEPVQVVVGGYFSEFAGMQVGGVAQFDGEAWQPLGDGIVGSVLAVAYAEDGAIYASTADDGTPGRPILARWDGNAWTDVATPEPGPVDAGYAFYSLLARGEYVVASGFAWPNSDQRNIFVYDGATFKSLRGGATAIYVESSALAHNGLWFGGTIAEAGPPQARRSSVGIAHLQ